MRFGWALALLVALPAVEAFTLPPKQKHRNFLPAIFRKFVAGTTSIKTQLLATPGNRRSGLPGGGGGNDEPEFYRPLQGPNGGRGTVRRAGDSEEEVLINPDDDGGGGGGGGSDWQQNQPPSRDPRWQQQQQWQGNTQPTFGAQGPPSSDWQRQQDPRTGQAPYSTTRNQAPQNMESWQQQQQQATQPRDGMGRMPPRQQSQSDLESYLNTPESQAPSSGQIPFSMTRNAAMATNQGETPQFDKFTPPSPGGAAAGGYPDGQYGQDYGYGGSGNDGFGQYQPNGAYGPGTGSGYADDRYSSPQAGGGGRGGGGYPGGSGYGNDGYGSQDRPSSGSYGVDYASTEIDGYSNQYGTSTGAQAQRSLRGPRRVDGPMTDDYSPAGRRADKGRNFWLSDESFWGSLAPEPPQMPPPPPEQPPPPRFENPPLGFERPSARDDRAPPPRPPSPSAYFYNNTGPRPDFLPPDPFIEQPGEGLLVPPPNFPGDRSVVNRTDLNYTDDTGFYRSMPPPFNFGTTEETDEHMPPFLYDVNDPLLEDGPMPPPQFVQQREPMDEMFSDEPTALFAPGEGEFGLPRSEIPTESFWGMQPQAPDVRQERPQPPQAWTNTSTPGFAPLSMKFNDVVKAPPPQRNETFWGSLADETRNKTQPASSVQSNDVVKTAQPDRPTTPFWGSLAEATNTTPTNDTGIPSTRPKAEYWGSFAAEVRNSTESLNSDPVRRWKDSVPTDPNLEETYGNAGSTTSSDLPVRLRSPDIQKFESPRVGTDNFWGSLMEETRRMKPMSSDDRQPEEKGVSRQTYSRYEGVDLTPGRGIFPQANDVKESPAPPLTYLESLSSLVSSEKANGKSGSTLPSFLADKNDPFWHAPGDTDALQQDNVSSTDQMFDPFDHARGSSSVPGSQTPLEFSTARDATPTSYLESLAPKASGPKSYIDGLVERVSAPRTYLDSLVSNFRRSATEENQVATKSEADLDARIPRSSAALETGDKSHSYSSLSSTGTLKSPRVDGQSAPSVSFSGFSSSDDFRTSSPLNQRRMEIASADSSSAAEVATSKTPAAVSERSSVSYLDHIASAGRKQTSFSAPSSERPASQPRAFGSYLDQMSSPSSSIDFSKFSKGKSIHDVQATSLEKPSNGRDVSERSEEDSKFDQAAVQLELTAHDANRASATKDSVVFSGFSTSTSNQATTSNEWATGSQSSSSSSGVKKGEQVSGNYLDNIARSSQQATEWSSLSKPRIVSETYLDRMSKSASKLDFASLPMMRSEPTKAVDKKQTRTPMADVKQASSKIYKQQQLEPMRPKAASKRAFADGVPYFATTASDTSSYDPSPPKNGPDLDADYMNVVEKAMERATAALRARDELNSSTRKRVSDWFDTLEKWQIDVMNERKEINLQGAVDKVADAVIDVVSQAPRNLAERTKRYMIRQANIVVDPPDRRPRAEGSSPVRVAFSTKGMTERIMKNMQEERQATGAGGISTWEGFQKAEENWAKLRALRKQVGKESPEFVVDNPAKGNPRAWAKLREQQDSGLDFDIVVCGGTLGIFFAMALQLKGHDVCVLEAGELRGREQEWNISYEELMELVVLGVLSEDDVEEAIMTEFPGCRAGFKNREVSPLKGGYFENGIGFECFQENVLNLGVSPAILIERVTKRFKDMGGVVMEKTPLHGVVSYKTLGAAVDRGFGKDPVTSHLVLDCMGNASPITKQARDGMKPDGICCVVGSCASGFDAKDNLVGDIIYTNTEIQDKGKLGMYQYFWEAFPVGIGRDGKLPGTSDVKTTYMFTYMDADSRRPPLDILMEDYWRLLPYYQPSIKNPETDLDIKRVLFAYFPTYRESPLRPKWDRVLAVGDASGIQSPLSFGGFGAMTRHLGRIAGAVSDAMENDYLDKAALREINGYTPNLSAAWMFQKAMSVRLGQRPDPKFVNRLLAVNFEVMDKLGPRTLKPFLQDVIRFDGLVSSLSRSFVEDPTFMPQIVSHVGIPTLVEWLGHVSMMGAYGFLDSYISPVWKPIMESTVKNERGKFEWRRRMEAWKFGSGNDYELPPKKRGK